MNEGRLSQLRFPTPDCPYPAPSMPLTEAERTGEIGMLLKPRERPLVGHIPATLAELKFVLAGMALCR